MPEPPPSEPIEATPVLTPAPPPTVPPAALPHTDDFVNFVFESDFGADSTGKAVFRKSLDHSACKFMTDYFNHSLYQVYGTGTSFIEGDTLDELVCLLPVFGIRI